MLVKFTIPDVMYKTENYTHAIISGVPDYLEKSCCYYNQALDEQATLTSAIKSVIPNVHEIPELHMDYITSNLESSLYIFYGSAILLKDRASYSDFVLNLLENTLKLNVISLPDKMIKLDGQDILYTGNEFYIGINMWTNLAGAQFLLDLYPEFYVTPITLPLNCHLKQYVTMAGPEVLCCSKMDKSKEIAKFIVNQSEEKYKYAALVLDEEIASNVIYANASLIHRDYEEITKSIGKLENVPIPRYGVYYKNLGDLSCGLTGNVLLFKIDDNFMPDVGCM